MTAAEVAGLEPALVAFLKQFDHCFTRSEPRGKLATFVRGQMSGLARKSVEPIALAQDCAPRTLQKFLTHDHWDAGELRDTLQRIVARDHATAGVIGVIDETSFVKRGDKTPGVQRQYCGSVGKVENGIVTVHLGYFDPASGFRTLLDSDLFLPEAGWDDPERRAAAHIPDDRGYQPKWQLALGQLSRARANGIRLAFVTADEGYGGKPGFLVGLAKQRQPFVVAVPRNCSGWLIPPIRRRGGRPPAPVATLCRYSPRMTKQAWTTVRIKETAKGPVVWQVRRQPFWVSGAGAVQGPYELLHAQSVLDPDEEKYFVAQAPAGTSVATLLTVAFGRAAIEQCFEDAKGELGLSHFEGRSYHGLLRHQQLTALTHLFLAQQTQPLGEKIARGHAGPSAVGGGRVDPALAFAAGLPPRGL